MRHRPTRLTKIVLGYLKLSLNFNDLILRKSLIKDCAIRVIWKNAMKAITILNQVVRYYYLDLDYGGFIKPHNFNRNNFHYFHLECTLSNGAPIVSRSVDQELNDVIDSVFKYYIGSWMEGLLFDDNEVYSSLYFI